MHVASPVEEFKAVWDAEIGERHVGHAHFWERAMSRRRLVGGAAGVVGATVASSWLPGLARAAPPGPGLPAAIPGGTNLGLLGFHHFYFPVGGPPGALTIESGKGDPSTITDFNGFIGVGDFIGGSGEDQSGRTLFWKADHRFMDGEYVGVDGRHRQGAFSFI
jgi:hypothetical protein